MSSYLPAYRMTVYAGRSVDNSEATVLTPAAGAPHSDQFKVITLSGVAGWKPYLGLIRGRRGRLDPLTKQVDVGELTIPILDYRAGALSDNLTRWVTTFLGDAAGESRMIGLKLYVEESTDGGTTWAAFFTGRISALNLMSPLMYEIRARDLSEDMQIPLFVGLPHATVAGSTGYAQILSLLPVGVSKSYGTVQTVPPLVGSVYMANSYTYEGVSYGWAAITLDAPSIGRIENVFSQELLDALPPLGSPTALGINTLQSVAVQNMTNARIHVKRTDTNAEGDFLLVGATPVGGFVHPLAGVQAVQSVIVQELPRANSTNANPPNFLAAPTTVGTPVQVTAVWPDIMRADSPSVILINDVHPAQLWYDILQGFFGYLWKTKERLPPGISIGGAKRVIAASSSTFDVLINDATFPSFRGAVTGRSRLDEWIQTALLQPYQFGYYLNGAGKVVAVDLRRPTTLPTVTIADADLVDAQTPLWEQSRDSAVTRVIAHYYEEWPFGTLQTQLQTATFPRGTERGITRFPRVAATLETLQHTVELLDIGRSDMGDKEITIDGIGFRGSKAETLQSQTRIDYLAQTLQGFVRNLQQPYGAGARIVTLYCRRTANTAINPGDAVLLAITFLPDSRTNLRGGTRVARCVERSENGLEVTLALVDLGVNVAASAPTLGIPTQQTGNTYHGASLPVTLDANNDSVEINHALTSTATTSPPSTGSAAWIFTTTVSTDSTGTVTASRLPSGNRVWFRGRSLPGAFDRLQLPSSWVPAASSGFVDLATLTAPSALATSSVDGRKANILWTPGATDLGTQVLLVTPSTDPLQQVQTLFPGANKYTFVGLTPGTSYKTAVRHTDLQGGVSANSTAVNFVTAAGSTTAPAIAGIYILQPPSA